MRGNWCTASSRLKAILIIKNCRLIRRVRLHKNFSKREHTAPNYIKIRG